MSEVLVQFDTPIVGRDGRTFFARACGRLMPDGRWEGWIEFVPTDALPPVRTPRETTQPNFEDLMYWATGLTMVYLEGALGRALAHAPPAAQSDLLATPPFEGPAPPRRRDVLPPDDLSGPEL
jgi:hypothetical protein